MISTVELEDVQDVIDIAKDCGLSEWSVEGLRSEIVREDSIRLAIRQDQVTLGFLLARMVSESELDILNFGISKSYQNKGIGSLLWNHLLKQISKRHLESIWLEVRESNINAIRFYQNRGFAVVQRRKNFYSSPVDNALLMKLVFEKF